MSKKKKMIIVTGVSVAIFLIVGLLFLHHLYYYERSIMANSVLVKESMSEQQAETIVLYKYAHFGIVDEETPQPAESKKIVELTDDQKDMIRSLIDGKNWSPHRRLWYRFDAIITCDNGRRYMLDMENGIIFIEASEDEPEYLYGVDGDISDVGWKIRSCVILSENELTVLRKELKGTGVKPTD